MIIWTVIGSSVHLIYWVLQIKKYLHGWSILEILLTQFCGQHCLFLLKSTDVLEPGLPWLGEVFDESTSFQ